MVGAMVPESLRRRLDAAAADLQVSITQVITSGILNEVTAAEKHVVETAVQDDLITPADVEAAEDQKGTAELADMIRAYRRSRISRLALLEMINGLFHDSGEAKYEPDAE